MNDQAYRRGCYKNENAGWNGCSAFERRESLRQHFAVMRGMAGGKAHRQSATAATGAPRQWTPSQFAQAEVFAKLAARAAAALGQQRVGIGTECRQHPCGKIDRKSTRL